MRRRTPEHERMAELASGTKRWHQWGPYVGDRQWGTVREDYSPDGEAWRYFSHEHARSRAYRWGEDGIAGLSDSMQRLCLSLALWNGQDPFLKERLFGLTNEEGNHGEDVKELYYHLDATPTHSYLKFLYKYPQAAFPYGQLREENRRRGRDEPEYELLDTGVFDGDRYFDVFVEYAKADVTDTLMRITAHNRGPEPAELHLLPQLWFRNTWSWGHDPQRPGLRAVDESEVVVHHARLGDYHWYLEEGAALLFCENETNTPLLYGSGKGSWFKDAFHDAVVRGRAGATNPDRTGTKAAAHYRWTVPPGGRVRVRLRLTLDGVAGPFDGFDTLIEARRSEADAYYAVLQQGLDDEEARRVQRQALAGMIWNKQFYYFDVSQWLDGDPAMPPPPPGRERIRNGDWRHLNNAEILSLPDKWEYPWYAAWDLAFHCVTLALVDPAFAKKQLLLMTRVWYQHPNGQIPAYEWNFSDVNPPVHAWAVWEVYRRERDANGGIGDRDFLERALHKLLLNFTWWANRKDADGNNIFQGGFLGLDNIGVFDRSKPLPTGGHINQADGTGWMAMYCLNLMRIALELARTNRVYEDISTKFFEHFLHIAAAMHNIGGRGVQLWNDEDEFFYDVLRFPDGTLLPLRLRSMVGLIPLFAVEILEPELIEMLPDFKRRLKWFLDYRPELAAPVSEWEVPGRGNRRLLSLLRADKLTCLLRRMLDETEFLSDYGVRSLSRAHRDQPYVFDCVNTPLSVSYEPGESRTWLFGGNSNWRGPVWFPLNYLLINALRRYATFYGDSLTVECPTGSGRQCTLDQVADELSRRLTGLFLRGADGRRPIYGSDERLQRDPHFRDYLMFHEYFHGDDGRGLGASHQTGWTGLVALLLQEAGRCRATPNPCEKHS